MDTQRTEGYNVTVAQTCGSLANLCHVATALGNLNEVDLCMELNLEDRREN